MAQQKILARDIIAQIETAVANTWVSIEGMTSVTPNFGEDAEDTDVTDFDSAGRPESIPTQRGASFGVEGWKLLDSVTGDDATGQLRCETLADTLGYPGRGRFRFRHPLKTEWRVWTVVCTPGEIGSGGNNDAGAWNMTIKRSGAATTAPVL